MKQSSAELRPLETGISSGSPRSRDSRSPVFAGVLRFRLSGNRDRLGQNQYQSRKPV